jgi:hypothetical protein
VLLQVCYSRQGPITFLLEMTSLTYFSSPFNTAAHVDIKQVSFYEKTRKRKRPDPEETANEDELTGSSYHEGSYSSAEELAKGPTLAQDIDLDEKFPHAPLKSERSKSLSYSRSELAKELAHMKPPLHLASDSNINRDTGLKQQHLGVLTTLMHTCLMKGDYIRAGRAWGLLLRAEVKGRPMDLRSNGLWGLGAEILLQRDIQLQKNGKLEEGPQKLDVNSRPRGGVGGRSLTNQEMPTDNGFRAAKEYYNRLIVQHRFNKTYPEAISDLHFYQAMFCLWISHIYDKLQAAQTDYSRVSQDSASASADEYGSDVNDASESATRRDNVRRSTLEEALEIAGQLDGLLVSFPYSVSLPLWNIRGMLALWMRDLCLPGRLQRDMKAGTGTNSTSISSPRTPMDLSTGGRSIRGHQEDKEIDIEKARIHQEKATAAFERVKELENRQSS